MNNTSISFEEMKNDSLTIKQIKKAISNTKFNQDGKAVISKDDKWVEETEWDDLFESLKKERRIE